MEGVTSSRYLAGVAVLTLMLGAGCGADRVSAADVAAHEEADLRFPGSSVVEPVARAEWRSGFAPFGGDEMVHSAEAGAYLKAPPGVGEDQILDFYRQELDRRGWVHCGPPLDGLLQFCRGQREVVRVGFTNPDSDAAGEGPGLAYYVFYYLTPTHCPGELSCPGGD